MELTHNEKLIINQCLNWCINGSNTFKSNNTIEKYIALYEKIKSGLLGFSTNDLQMIISAISFSIKDLDWEFSTLIGGCNITEAKKLIEKLMKIKGAEVLSD